MAKSVIFIASLLKPVDEPRMYEKLAYSLSQTNKYEVNIIGSYSNSASRDVNIIFHPVFQNSRFSFLRLFPSSKIWKVLIKLKPEVIIANSHELLIVSILYKILFGCNLIYDIRENYAINLLSQKVYPPIIAYPLAAWVRLKEITSKPFIAKYLLAEKSYFEELTFCQSKSVILQNKYQPEGNDPNIGQRTMHRFLFSGTLSKSAGVFEAINLVKSLHELDNRISLVIIGYCPILVDRIKLKEQANKNSFITLIGIDTLVGHARIMDEIRLAHFGIISYRLNASNRDCVPTKLYEYLANDLLVVSVDNHQWNELIKRHQTGLFFDTKNFEPETILENLGQLAVLDDSNKEELMWSSEEPKLLELVNLLVPQKNKF